MDTIVNLLSIATIVAQIFVILSIISWLFGFRRNETHKYISERRLFFAFLVALIATLGSLYFSEIAGLEPCKLCWFQRIFMYPQAVILLVAYLKKDEGIGKYSLSLSAIGILFSAYHIYVQQVNAPTMCLASGPTCEVPEFLKYGYITIPVMAFTAFSLIITLFTIYRKSSDNL